MIMDINKSAITSVLSKYNPWWGGGGIIGLPKWRRIAFNELFEWVYSPPAPRAVLLSGLRQIGKTTLLLQIIEALLKKGVPGTNILFASFDDWVIKNVDIDVVLEAWREREPLAPGPEYLFLDEAQFIPNIGTWVKHQVDFFKNRRIIFTGSAMPIIAKDQESGVGRWHTISLSTLSFYEYLQFTPPFIFPAENKIEKLFYQLHESLVKMPANESASFEEFIKKIQEGVSIENKATISLLAEIPKVKHLQELFSWKSSDFQNVSQLATAYVGHFHQYLLRGGFPQIAKIQDIDNAQKLLRDDLIEKVINRDMAAIYKVSSQADLEKLFIYLCMHDGGVLSIDTLSNNLQIARQTVERYLQFLEDIHLIYRLRPFGYGKEILRSNYKVYLADPSIVPSILSKGKSILDDPKSLGRAVEAAVFKHLLFYYPHYRFTVWQNKEKNHETETDLVAEYGELIIPFEIKYRSSQHTQFEQLRGLVELCRKNKAIKQAYVVTKSIQDFGLKEIKELSGLKILHIPASLLCYWL
jgi:uncharacterized protein